MLRTAENKVMKFFKVGLIAASLTVIFATPGATFAKAPVATAAKVAAENANYEMLYPGVYTAREKELVEKYIAANKALQTRGPIDVKALIAGTLPKDTPGVGPVIPATKEWIAYNNSKYDPENPLLNDSKYAQAHGHKDVMAYPTFAAHDDTFMVPYPPAARDRLLVSDLNHSVTNYRPIYPGDTLYLVANEREVLDLTPPEGSYYRSIAIQTKGSIYNQHGDKVQDVIFRVTEGIKVAKPGKELKNPSFMDIWDAPNWLSRPLHKYTAQDWAKIKGIWAKEKRQGDTPLYWEDVKVGSTPAETVDGPIAASVSPTPPWGMGAGGSRSLKKEIMDPVLAKSLLLNSKTGAYHTANKADEIPPLPGAEVKSGAATEEKGAINTADIHKEAETRSALINYVGRDYAIRHLNNWMGDKGWLQNIRWSIMEPRAHALYGKQVATDPNAVRYLDKVPSLKGKFVSTHGLTNDVAIVKSYVQKKYIKDGDFLVDLIWWVETIDGAIFEEGGATIKLPSKSAK